MNFGRRHNFMDPNFDGRRGRTQQPVTAIYATDEDSTVDNNSASDRIKKICPVANNLCQQIQQGSDLARQKEAPKAIHSLRQQFNIEIGEVRSTHALKYSSHGASELPGELLDMLIDTPLMRIDLSSNNLEKVPDRLTLPPLSETILELNLMQNRISNLNESIGRITCLSILDLSGNFLFSLPSELSQLRHLRQLMLTSNPFEEIPEPVYTLPKLENLLLASNKITRLETSRLRGMTSLGTLDLSNNSLSTVPPELGLCKHLRNLHLGGNPFRIPRPTHLAKGTTFVLEYLRNRIEGGRRS